MSGSARSHSRLRASGDADLLAARGRGMSDREAARVLKRLDQAAPELPSTPEVVAAVLRMTPGLSDDEAARRVRGAEPAMVALVRANGAAGRAPGHGLTDDPQRPPGRRPRAAEGSGKGDVAGRSQRPPPPEPLRPVPQRALTDADLVAMMPSYRVVAADGTVHPAPSYGAARLIRARVGGQVQAVTRS